MADVEFDQDDPFAVTVEKKFRKGVLNSVSVGWETLESDGKRSTKQTLLDISAVNIPGDPGALMERQVRAFSETAKLLETLVEDPENETPTDEAVWTGTAAAMVRLYLPDASESEADRKRSHQRLARRYERMNKTAPEYLPLDTVDGLTADEVRGLFLEDEPVLLPEFFARAGAVLSARNHNDLDQAISLIQGVMARATKQEDTEPTEPEADETVMRLYNILKKDKTNE
jgi:hypothetical protein